MCFAPLFLQEEKFPLMNLKFFIFIIMIRLVYFFLLIIEIASSYQKECVPVYSIVASTITTPIN